MKTARWEFIGAAESVFCIALPLNTIFISRLVIR